jgi:hypothetical protein
MEPLLSEPETLSMPKLPYESIKPYGLIYGEKHVLCYTRGKREDVFLIRVGLSNRKIVGQTFPLTEEGWRQAFAAFAQLEPKELRKHSRDCEQTPNKR